MSLAPKDIHADMVTALWDDAPVLSTVKKRPAEYKRRRESLEDDARSGQSSTSPIVENIDHFHHIW